MLNQFVTIAVLALFWLFRIVQATESMREMQPPISVYKHCFKALELVYDRKTLVDSQHKHAGGQGIGEGRVRPHHGRRAQR